VSALRALALGALAAALAGCAAGGPRFGVVGPVEPLRLSEIAGDGDAARRASQRLVLQGLTADAQGNARSARTSYERALQVDANNPYAYLALARQSVDDGDGAAALEYLDQAELLLGAEGERSPRVDPHLAGLRGGALRESGNESRARTLLHDAAQSAPSVWDDGRLDADELR
jgi:hypothetical protein